LSPLALLRFVVLLAHISLLIQCNSIAYGTMLIGFKRFNHYLAIAALIVTSALLGGCKSTGKKNRHAATLRIYLESKAGSTKQVAISRDQKVMLNVQQEPFLTESLVSKAKVIDTMGGFALEIGFEQKGSWLLEQYTGDNRGRHLAIFSQFVPPNTNKVNEGRWLAAPKILSPISGGTLTFTPDATREEAEVIASGLTRVAKKMGNEPRSW